MKSVALFNNKGGVGKTTLAYHLGFMFAELGHRVVFADLDPQANLTAMCVADERIEEIWKLKPRPTIYGAIEPLRRGGRDVVPPDPESISEKIVLLTGDLELSEIEDDLAQQWPRCLDGDERAFRMTTALHRVVAEVGKRSGADVAVIDSAPSFGALNRVAMLASDHVVVPVAADAVSVRGLDNVGARLKTWREQWRDRRACAPALEFDLPLGGMQALGYVLARHPAFMGRPIPSFQRWIDRMPAAYRHSFDLPSDGALEVAADPLCLAQLKDYRSLIPMAQEARRPMFLLRPADGAIGGHQGAVREAYDDFRLLAATIIARMGGLS